MQKNGEVAATLKSAGLRSTEQRARILQVLEDSQYPLSVADIAAQTGRPRIDQVTIYRTLEAFVHAGLVHHLELHQGRSFFELAMREHHHHLVCRSCGHVEDVEDCGMDALERKVIKKSKIFSRVTTHALEFFGDCKECVKAK